MPKLRRRSRPTPPRYTVPPPSWVGPWWLQRQRDPRSAGYHPTTSAPVNAVGRSWTLLGSLDDGPRALVDPRGLVSLADASWAVDWWVRADDEWVHPSRSGAVRQRSIRSTPVVETVLRLPGGEIVHRSYGARGQEAGEPVTVLEVENEGRAPVTLGLAIRPFDGRGGGSIHEIDVDGCRVTVDGSAALVLPREAGVVAMSAGGEDVAVSLDDPVPSSYVACAEGRATAVLLFPLVHTATMRFVLHSGGASEDACERVPSAAQVASGWRRHLDSGARVAMPEGRLADAIESSLASTMLTHRAGHIDTTPLGPRPDPAPDLVALMELDRWGHAEAVKTALIASGRGQDARGGVVAADGTDCTASTLCALAHHLALHHDEALATALSEFAADAARWLVEQPAASERDLGLRSAALSLRLSGHREAAAEIETLLEMPPVELTAVIAEIEALPLMSAPDATNQLIHADEGPGGLDVLGSALSVARAVVHDPSAGQLLESVVEVMSDTGCWPTFVHPRLHTGTGGVGDDLRVAATVCRIARNLMVSERGAGLEFARWWTPSWLGHGVEVHEVSTVYGRASWAVRWHGDRPALLWRVEPTERQRELCTGIRITAPGLDPAWSTEELVGEALLAAWTPPDDIDLTGPAELEVIHPTDDDPPDTGGSFV